MNNLRRDSFWGNFLTLGDLFDPLIGTKNYFSDTLDWRHVWDFNYAAGLLCSQHYYRAYSENVEKATCLSEKIRTNETKRSRSE